MDKTQTIKNKNSLVKLLENKQVCNQIVMWNKTFNFFSEIELFEATEHDKIIVKLKNIEIGKYLKQAQK